MRAELLRVILRNKLHTIRGGYRFATALAAGLDSVPLKGPCLSNPVYVDLRGLRGPAPIFFANGITHEPETVALLRAILRPSDVAYDIGAHIGVIGSVLAELVREVHCFEANPRLVSNLRRTLRQYANTELHEFAIGDRDGEVTFYLPDDDHCSSLADWTGQPGTSITCPIRRLDGLGLPVPDFMKVDVEGAEFLVFRGAENILDRETAPVIFFEELTTASRSLGYEEGSAAQFLRDLKRPGYQLFGVEPQGLSVKRRSAEVLNTLAVPASRMDRLNGVNRF